MSETDIGNMDGVPFDRWVESSRGLIKCRPAFDRVTVFSLPDRFVLQVVEGGAQATAALSPAEAARIAALLTVKETGVPSPPPPEPQPTDTSGMGKPGAFEITCLTIVFFMLGLAILTTLKSSGAQI